jgi:Mg2+ and Co2+ transporter CorA
VTVTINNELPQNLVAGETGVSGPSDTDNVSLHVDGDVSVNGRAHMVEMITDKYYQVSDRNKKDKVEDADTQKSLAVVQQLQPKTYVMKDSKSGKRSIGFIAQDAEEIDSKLVTISEKGDYALNYNEIGVHTTVAVQDVLRRLQALELMNRDK